MQFSGGQRIGGPAAVIIVVTLIMLGAMAFAVPPARIEVEATGVERGYLVSHSRFSSTLAANVAADGYTYLVIDLTRAGAEEGAHWSGHLERVNEVQFPVWGWIELDSAAEREAVRLAQEAIVAQASARELVKQAQSEESRKHLAAEERKAAVRAEDARRAAKHASAEWKLKELIPGLSLRGVYVVGPGAVARASRLQRDNARLKVLPVVTAGSAAPDGPHAVAFDVDAFVEGAKGVDFPILAAAGIGLEKIEPLRSKVEGNYLVATIPVAGVPK